MNDELQLLVNKYNAEIETLKEEIKDLKQHKADVYRIYVDPLFEYSGQGKNNSHFPLGCSIVAETIRRAKAFDAIKELLK